MDHSDLGRNLYVLKVPEINGVLKDHLKWQILSHLKFTVHKQNYIFVLTKKLLNNSTLMINRLFYQRKCHFSQIPRCNIFVSVPKDPPPNVHAPLLKSPPTGALSLIFGHTPLTKVRVSAREEEYAAGYRISVNRCLRGPMRLCISRCSDRLCSGKSVVISRRQ